jgi:imidazolonepropionase-like amidohydrolase
MAHTYTARQIARAVRFGVRSVEHCNFLDDDAAKLIVEKNAFMVPTLVAYETMWREGLEIGMPPELHAKIKTVLDVGAGSLEVAQRHGLNMAYGTDLIGPLHRHQTLEFKIRAEVLPVLEVIRSATCYAAELFRMVGEIGVVAAGARADLIAVDGNPLDDLDLLVGQGERLALIMKDGRIYKNTLP